VWYADGGLQRIDVTAVLIQFVLLVISLTVHEAAHAWSANRLGDSTARRLGRLSLNPAVHVDPVGTLLLPLVGMLTTGSFIGWAKPVPVNLANLRGNWKQKHMLIAAAGPASNLLLAIIGAIALQVITAGSPFETSAYGVRVLFFFVNLNVLLAVFNLVPVPPLDGGNVLASLLPRHLAEPFEQLRPWGFLIVIGLAATGILWMFIEPIQTAILRVLL
jgi:Zn-dependent protease